MKILILGASGMLGNAMMRVMAETGEHGLVGWFLEQEGSVKGYRRAIFSGLYHVAAAPIAKFDLLELVATAYGKSITIEPDDRVVIDRSLNADHFHEATGYVAPAWPDLIAQMRDFK